VGVWTAAPAAHAEFPYPSCAAAGCPDPADFQSYLHTAPGELPDDLDPADDGSWKYLPGSGVNVTGAWEVTTGRPDVVGATLDSGIRWSAGEVARSVYLNVGELPLPMGCMEMDCNGDGFVGLDDYDVPDHNANGIRDGQDVIIEYSDDTDGDGNGFVDDIAGWDFLDDDNDPFDDVDYGHGTGEAADQVSEANDGAGRPGFAPSSRHLPLRVGDSFVALGPEFARAVVYAVDRGVDYISEALGTLSASPTSQAAIDYAYRRGVPIVASAADEESRHHNLPAALDHTIWVNSIVHEDGTMVEDEAFDYLNGCTNYSGHAWVAISSNSCSSEATGRAAGMVSLLIAQGKNLIDRGELDPYPGLGGRPFSAEEVRQLLRLSADDIAYDAPDRELSMFALLQFALSAEGLGLIFHSERFPTQPGWDQYTGYGRPDTRTLVNVVADAIPPEADLAGNVSWFDTFDPAVDRRVSVRGSLGAVRAAKFQWTLEEGCGVQPTEWASVGKGKGEGFLEDVVLGKWKPRKTEKRCDFDPGAPPDDPDSFTVTLRLRVEDDRGNVGEDRKTVAVHRDSSLAYPPIRLGSSAESSGVLADVDGDGTLDILHATSDGRVYARRGADGKPLAGFPVRTDAIPVHSAAPGWSSGEVPVPHEPVLGALAADDLDGDGVIEIVAVSTEGQLYVWDATGARRAGFPVSGDPAFSNPLDRDQLNDTERGFFAAPTLADLDDDGVLHILVAGLDGHLYAWDPSGVQRSGFPVRIADPARVALDPVTGKATPLPDVDAKERGRKLVSSPALADFDDDGRPEIILGSNEEYGGEPDGWAPESFLTQTLLDLGDDLGGFELEVQSRLYAVHPDGNDAPGGPFLPGWPVRVPMLVSGLLPTVATGTPGAPAVAEIDDAGTLAIAIFGSVGPAALFGVDGTSLLGELDGRRRVLATDFEAGFPNVPASAGSPDAPFFPALGAGAFGDLGGDGLPEFVAPTGGVRKLLDAAAPASQTFADHQVTAWNPQTGAVLPAFPRVMDDMQFLTSPSIGRVSEAGPSIVQGSGAYLLHAFDENGVEPEGWPKFTHGWLISSPLLGDVDGDGLIEVAAATREGKLYVWNTPAEDGPDAVQWQGFGRDRRNSSHWNGAASLSAGTPDPKAALGVWLAGIANELQDGGAPEAAKELVADMQAGLTQEDWAASLDSLGALQGELLDAAKDDEDLAPLTLLAPRALAVSAGALRHALDCAGDKKCTKDDRRLGKSVSTLEKPRGHLKAKRVEKAARAFRALEDHL
jgi:hypothetical protein